MKVENVIFDMDGVIIDSEPMWAEAQIELLSQYDVVITEADCEHLTRGRRINEIADIWINRYGLTVTSEKFAQAMLSSAYDKILQNGIAMTGLYDILAFLHRKHIKIGLATSSDEMIIQAVFDKLKLWDFFSIRCSANQEQYGKPHPAVYLTALENMQANTNNTIVLEDSVTGLIAAKAAGLTTFIVNSNYQENCFAIADERFATLSDVIKRLENIDFL